MVEDIAIKGVEPKKRDLEEILSRVKQPPVNNSGARYPSRFESTFPVRKATEEIDFTNYTKRSQSGLQELAKSLETHCLLEPIVLSYNTFEDSWKIIDGRRRFGASYIAGFDYVPVKIFYDLPPEIEERLMVALNSTKEKISSADIANFASQIKKYIVNFNKRHVASPIPTTNKAVGKILSRSPDTISQYNYFNRLPSLIKDFIKGHPDQRLFSKGVSISKAINDPDAQLEFFNFLKERILDDDLKRKKKEEMKRSSKKFTTNDLLDLKPMSKSDFEKDLTSFAQEHNNREAYEQENGKGALYMTSSKAKKSSTNPSTRFIKSVNEVHKYVTNFKKLVDLSSEFSQDFLDANFNGVSKDEFIKNLTDTYAAVVSSADEHIKSAVLTFLNKEDVTDNEEYMSFIKTKRKGGKQNGDYVLRAIGEEELELPIDKVRLAPRQVRTSYNDSSIDDLADEMSLVGQVKPGLVKPVYDSDGSLKHYIVIYGHRRYKAAKKAGLQTYTAFVRDDLESIDAGLLQSIEDLSEKDTPLERARKLYSQYDLIRQQRAINGDEFTQEEFIRTHRSLQSPKTMRDYFDLLSLPEELQYCVDKKLLSKANALLAKDLSKDAQFSILYNALVNNLSGHKIKSIINENLNKEKLERDHGVVQQSMFADETKSYVISLNQFESKLKGLFSNFANFAKVNASAPYMQNGQGTAVYLAMAKLTKEVGTLNGSSSIQISESYTRILGNQ